MSDSAFRQPSVLDLVARSSSRQSIFAYIESLVGERQFRVATMLAAMVDVLELIHRDLGSVDPLPEVVIESSGEPRLGALANQITISTGFVEHCLAIPFAPISEIVKTKSPWTWWDDSAVAVIGLIWAVAHEYFHIVRPHVVFDEPDGSRQLDVALATERDADLCAAAWIYRHMQRHCSQSIDDMTIRQTVLFGIFWVLRPLQVQENGTHFPTLYRLMDIATKLSIVYEMRGILPDRDAVDPQSHRRFDELLECLVMCEKAFAKLMGCEVDSTTLLAWENDETHARVLKLWESLRGRVDRGL